MRAHIGRGLVTRKRKTPCGSSVGPLKYFRTVESKSSASEESFDCLLPNETSGTGQQLNFSDASVSVVACGSLAVSSSVSGSSSATSVECATRSDNAVSQSDFAQWYWVLVEA